MKTIFNDNTLAVTIFVCCVIFIGAVLCIIRDNIVNDKKGLNPQIAMVVSLGVFGSIVTIFICRCIYLASSFIITKILDEMLHGHMILTIIGAVVIAVAMTVYWVIRIDDLSGNDPEEDQTYESDKNDEIEPQEEHHDLVEAAPEEHESI
mgnify:CR=1 FL=1